jgi:hypothetical protein
LVLIDLKLMELLGRIMPGNSPTNIHIDSVHSSAICEEIGYRLNQILKIESMELPPYLARLTDRLQRDGVLAPPLVPSLPSMHPEDEESRFSPLLAVS